MVWIGQTANQISFHQVINGSLNVLATNIKLAGNTRHRLLAIVAQAGNNLHHRIIEAKVHLFCAF